MAKYYGEESYFNNDVTFYRNVNIRGNLNFDFSTDLTVSGKSTLGVTTTTSLFAQNLSVSGISTLGTVQISSGIVTATSGITTYYGDGSKLTGIVSIPTGVIVMWSGTIANIPTGWALCNGSNGTPDLRSRFIVGAGTDTANTWSFDATTGVQTFTNGQTSVGVGSTGGSVGVGLTIGEMPAHTHTGAAQWPGSGPEQNQAGGPEDRTTFNVNTGSTGGDKYHENRPPYFALAFIMKT
jgi:microcystin-dependent protein